MIKFIMKLANTIKILFTLGIARTFGKYEIDVWNGSFTYAIYLWKGKKYIFPKTPLDE